MFLLFNIKNSLILKFTINFFFFYLIYFFLLEFFLNHLAISQFRHQFFHILVKQDIMKKSDLLSDVLKINSKNSLFFL